jgi:hypothetical protein
VEQFGGVGAGVAGVAELVLPVVADGAVQGFDRQVAELAAISSLLSGVSTP